MSGIHIIKNVYNFAQILNLASSKNLGKWNHATLQKALSWAHYCEEVYKHVQQQECGDDMNIKILQLSVLLKPPSLLRLSFESLKTATKLLAEIILNNPHGNPDIQKEVRTIVSTTCGSEDSGHISARSIPANDLDELFFIVRIQNPISCQRSVTTYAQIFLTNLIEILKTSENLLKFQLYCECLCDRLISLDGGWELLVQIFSIDLVELPLEWEEQKHVIWNIILSWMASKTQDVGKCPVLDVDLNLLKMASIRCFGFSTFHLSCLEKWSKCFQPCVDGSGNDIWRDNDGIGASLFSEHFYTLLNDLPDGSTEKALKSNVLTVLSNNIKSSDFTVWRRVGKALLGHS